MARKAFALFGVIGLEGASAVFKQLNAIDKKAKDVSKQLMKTGRAFEKVGKGMTKTFTVPIAIAGAAILKFGGDFEKAMTTSLAIMGDVSDKMKKEMSGAARDMSKRTKQSAAELANAYYFLASAGYDAAQSIKALPVVTKFATAGNFEMSLATDLLTDALSALGMAVDDAAKNEINLIEVSDVLVKANTLANASVQQFSESLTNKAGAALKILGKTVQEGTAVLAAYADQGVKGAEAGTQLGIVLRDLQKAAINNEQAFKDSKISVFDNAGEMRNMADVIGDVESSLEGMSDKQKKATLSTLGFQEKSISSLLTLIGTSEKIREYQVALEDAAGTTENVSEKQLQNFNDQLTILKNRLIDVAIGLSQDLLPVMKNRVVPAVEEFIKKIQGLIDKFRALPSGVKETIFRIVGLTAVMGPAFMITGKLMTAIAGLRTTVLLLNQALLANPFGLFGLAVVAVGVSVVGLKNKMRDLRLEHEKYIILTTDQAKNNDLLESFDKLQDGMLANKAALKDNATFYKHFGKEVDELSKKARELGKEIVGNTTERYQLIEAIANELTGARSLTGVTKTYAEMLSVVKKRIEGTTKATKDNTESIDENSNAVDKNSSKKLEAILADSAALRAQREEFLAADKKIADDKKLQRESDLLADQEAADRMYNMKLSYEEKLAEKKKNIANLAIDSVYQAFDIFSSIYENQQITLDNYYNKERENIELSAESEAIKQQKIKALDEKTAKEKAKINRKAANLEKVSAIFSIGLSTAQGIMKGYAQLGPIGGTIAAVIIGALGVAQTAIAASKPLPQMADGGIVKNKIGGVDVKVAEAGQDELIMPLKTGIDAISSSIMGKLNSGGNSVTNKGITLNVGTLIADRMGIKKLHRMLQEFDFSEAERVMA